MNKINIIKPNKTNDKLEEIINLFFKNIEKVIDFWNQYCFFEKDLNVIFADENDYDWLYDQCLFFNMETSLPEKKSVNSKHCGGGGGIHGKDNQQPVFWQIVGSDITKYEMLNTGNIKMFGHLYSHTVQTKMLHKFLEYPGHQSEGVFPIKVTDYPCWFIEGQADYHTLKLLDNNFLFHKNNFLTVAYVPSEYRKLIKDWSIKEWKEKLLNDSPFDGIPITHQYWSGFFIYEYLIDIYGMDLLIDVMLDFSNTFNFNLSMKRILSLDIDKFYDDMSIMLFDLAKKVVV